MVWKIFLLSNQSSHAIAWGNFILYHVSRQTWLRNRQTADMVGRSRVSSFGLFSTPMSLPLPPELFARFERGEIERDELHRLMALHACEIIEEMEEDYQNPAAAWWEGMLARRAMHRLQRVHGAPLLRDVLLALSASDFPAARYLWNADHPDVPLHCFLRMKRKPIFRLLSVHESGKDCIAVFESDGPEGEKPVKHRVSLIRDRFWKLRLVSAPASSSADG